MHRWCESGVIERIFRYLAANHDNEYMMIDGTIIRTRQHSADIRKKGARIRPSGRYLGGLPTKIHAIVDAAGKALALCPDTRAKDGYH